MKVKKTTSNVSDSVNLSVIPNLKKERKLILGRKKNVRKLAFTIVDGLMELTEKEMKRKVEFGVLVNQKPTSENNIFNGSHFEMTFCIHKDYGNNKTRLDIIYLP